MNVPIPVHKNNYSLMDLKKVVFDPLILALRDQLDDHLPHGIEEGDVFKIVDFLNTRYRYDIDNRYDGMVIYSRADRELFKRSYDEQGNRYWVFSKILQLLVDENILYIKRRYAKGKKNATTYGERSKLPIYDYTDIFLDKLSQYQYGISYQDVVVNTKQLEGKKQIDSKLMKDNYHVLTKKLKLAEDNYIFEKMLDSLRSKYSSREPQDQQRMSILAISRLNNILIEPLLTLLRGEKSGRVIHSFNMINSVLRPYFEINGEPLVELDLRSSQPFIFASFLLKNYNKQGLNNPELLKDIRNFYGIVANDDIYTWLADRYNEMNGTYEVRRIGKRGKWGVVDLSDRDKAKEEFFSFIYKPSNRGNTVIGDVMKNYFPALYEHIKDLRKRYAAVGLNLAVELQRQEVEIFVEGTKHLVRKGLLTVHDAIYCPESMKDEVLGVLKEKLLGMGLRGWTIVESPANYRRETYELEHNDQYEVQYEIPEPLRIEAIHQNELK